jgi:hypothetical protein
MMVVSEQFRGSRWIAILLSSDGEPEESLAETGPDPSATKAPRTRSIRVKSPRESDSGAGRPSPITKA